MNPNPRKKGPPRKADWPTVDWSQKNQDLAESLKVSIATISRNRVAFGHPRVQIDWPNIDWSKKNKEIHHEYGVALSTIARYRTIHAPKTQPTFDLAKRMAAIDWNTVDWSIPTGKLAEDLGIPRNYLYPKRCELAPETVARRRKTPDDIQFDWSKSDGVLSGKHRLCYETVRRIRKLQAPETVKSKIDWASIDWSRRNPDIARETKCCIATVSIKRGIHAPATAKTEAP
jgi:hypothetical protein